MARSKRDILDTKAMLERLKHMLIKHAPTGTPMDGYGGTARTDAESLRRISMTLHRWHELECGDSNSYGSWAIVRGRMRTFVLEEGKAVRQFEHDDDGKPYLERHHYRHGVGKDSVTHTPIDDREAGALKRLKAIMARYPSLSYYVQTDPRGCALYILKPGDVPEGADASSYYSRGLAVFQ